MPQLLLALLLLAPADGNAASAIERLNTALAEHRMVAAYEQFTEKGRAELDKLIKPMAKRVGLDETASAVEVLKALETMIAALPKKQVADTPMPKFTIVKRGAATEDRVPMTLSLVFARSRNTVEVTVVKKDSIWRIDDFSTKKDRIKANETMATATLRQFVAAQAQFQAVGYADADEDGVGEFGFLGELSGGVKVRGDKVCNPPMLSAAFQKVEKGRLTRSGYHFRMFLCDKDGKPVGEEHGTKTVDATLAETTWCAYAWPVKQGKTGKRTFFVNQAGVVLTSTHSDYSGGYSGDSEPKATAAFAAATPATEKITGPTAKDKTAADGNMWGVLR